MASYNAGVALIVLFAWLVLGTTPASAAAAAPAQSAAPPSSSCAITTDARVVAVGDIHGGYDRLIAILRRAGIIDSRDRWAAGRTIFVQTGDVLDRGAHSRRALDLLRRLEREAAEAGGAVHVLLGNHEIMRLTRDMRYVSAQEYAAFRTADSSDLRERYYEAVRESAANRAKAAGQRFDERAFRRQFFDAIPLGFVEMQMAFEPTGPYGRWLRERDTMVRVNDVAFVHGGISPQVAALGCDTINATVRTELQTFTAPDDPALEQSLAVGADGPVWYRGLAADDSPLTVADVDGILEAIGARTIVVGHTSPPGYRMRARYDGRVVQIDTGLLGAPFFPGGRASALDIQDGVFTAIYEDRREVLFERRAP